jgi:hypothetical protein
MINEADAPSVRNEELAAVTVPCGLMKAGCICDFVRLWLVDGRSCAQRDLCTWSLTGLMLSAESVRKAGNIFGVSAARAVETGQGTCVCV